MNNDLPAKNLDELLTNNGIKFPIHLAQDFVNEIFHYGIIIKGKTFIINSKKEMLSVPDLISKGYIPLTEAIEKSNFTKRGIINFMRTEKQVDAYKLFTSLTNYIKRFIIFKNCGYPELIALWIMGTYIYMVFQYYPYLHVTAEKASGKSLLLDIIAPVAFNGEISCNATPAVIYRDILINQPTMLIDEVENLNKYNPQGAGAIMDVLKSGFQKTGTVKRCVGDKFITKSFPTYSPKILTGINPLEEVLSDRTIKIQMVRKLDHEFVERYILTKELIEYQRTLRNVLYIFGLTHSNKIFELIKSFDYYNAEYDYLSNRNLDLYLPILLCSSIVDQYLPDGEPSLRKNMITLSKNIISDKYLFDISENITAKYLIVLDRLDDHLIPLWSEGNEAAYDTDAVLEFFQVQDEFIDDELRKSQLSRMLRTLDIEIRVYNREGKSAKQYIIDRVNLSDLMKRYC